MNPPRTKSRFLGHSISNVKCFIRYHGNSLRLFSVSTSQGDRQQTFCSECRYDVQPTSIKTGESIEDNFDSLKCETSALSPSTHSIPYFFPSKSFFSLYILCLVDSIFHCCYLLRDKYFLFFLFSFVDFCFFCGKTPSRR